MKEFEGSVPVVTGAASGIGRALAEVFAAAGMNVVLAGSNMNTYAVAYGVSKHAVVALSESLHLELLQRNVRVNVSVLCPGPVKTEFLNSAERNRPDTVPVFFDLTPEEILYRKAYEIYLSPGMRPKAVARQVLDAIRGGRFYVVTHDYNKAIEERLENILAAKIPKPHQPAPQFLDLVEELKSGLDKDN
jgi:short-subunit dehydrogenase